MTVEFMRGQSSRLQEHLFDIWIRLRRDPTGSQYRVDDIADAMILQALAAPPETPEPDTPELCLVTADSPRWYRRHRLTDRRVRPFRTRIQKRVAAKDPAPIIPGFALVQQRSEDAPTVVEEAGLAPVIA